MRNFLASTVLCFAIAPFAMAQQYSSTVLYQITTPNGMSGITLSNHPQSSVDGQTIGDGNLTDGDENALIWSASNNSVLNLNPPGFTNSALYATDGVQQVGYAWGNATTFNVQLAMLWSGTAASAVNLNPAGFDTSQAYSVAGTQQVGEGYGNITGNYYHALLWSGTAASAVDLNPAGFFTSQAYGNAGNQQVGEGNSMTTANVHALLWSGTAASAVDLNPAGFDESAAFGIGGNQEVGVVLNSSTANIRQAMLWSGTAASAVDLNPTNLTGFSSSEADATNGAEQVGYGRLSTGLNEALLWSGTAASTVNLQVLLPSAGMWLASYATSIDANGNVYGLAEGTLNGIYGDFAVEWSPIPEPTSFSVLAVGALGLLRRRRIRW